jgi:hypothetical protein
MYPDYWIYGSGASILNLSTTRHNYEKGQLGEVQDVRCSTAILAREPLRAPVASPMPWPIRGIERLLRYPNDAVRSRLDGGPSALSKTLTLTTVIADGTQPGASPPLGTSAMVSPMKTTKGRSRPLDTGPTVRRLDAASFVPLDTPLLPGRMPHLYSN